MESRTILEPSIQRDMFFRRPLHLCIPTRANRKNKGAIALESFFLSLKTLCATPTSHHHITTPPHHHTTTPPCIEARETCGWKDKLRLWYLIVSKKQNGREDAKMNKEMSWYMLLNRSGFFSPKILDARGAAVWATAAHPL